MADKQAKLSNDLEASRLAALSAAERCATLLTTQFGARRVVPFGSVLRTGSWRSDSDLDLAVDGVPPDQFFRAWSSLRPLLPDQLDVDLVDLASAHPQLRARILEEVEMSDDALVNLRHLVLEELDALERIVADLEKGLDALDELPPSQFEMNALASYVHQFYTGAERILQRISVHFDGGPPKGAFSHANMLAAMAQNRPGTRPAVLDDELWMALQDYLEFRHFFRHAYAYHLEWDKMQPLIDQAPPTLATFRQQINAFFNAVIDGTTS